MSPSRDTAVARLILHGSHHKTGTKWFERVLGAVAEEFGGTLVQNDLAALRSALDAVRVPGDGVLRQTIFFHEDHSRFDLDALPDFRGSHIIRDPRDVVISGYYYHLTATEIWLDEPQGRFGGRTYREHLQALDRRDGMVAEMHGTATQTITDMLAWSYDDPRFLEVRYEDLMADTAGGFRRLFEHYRLPREIVDRCVELALDCSIGGRAAAHRHIRSGAVAQWREELDDDLKAEFKRIHGASLVRLGYETSDDW